jgi:hypothetical protein
MDYEGLLYVPFLYYKYTRYGILYQLKQTIDDRMGGSVLLGGVRSSIDDGELSLPFHFMTPLNLRDLRTHQTFSPRQLPNLSKTLSFHLLTDANTFAFLSSP